MQVVLLRGWAYTLDISEVQLVAASRLFVASMGATLMVGDPTWPGMMDCPMHWKKILLGASNSHDPNTIGPILWTKYIVPWDTVSALGGGRKRVQLVFVAWNHFTSLARQERKAPYGGNIYVVAFPNTRLSVESRTGKSCSKYHQKVSKLIPEW